MAGKIALGILICLGCIAFGFKACEFRIEQHEQKTAPKLPFKIARVVSEGDTNTLGGMDPPFTVFVYDGPYVQMTLPGDLGQLGDVMYMPDPRQNSESTTLP